jgi:SH3-like domain-containing protein
MKFYFALTIILAVFLTDTVFAERLSVSVPVANIRSGPGTQYPVLWNSEKYFPIQVLKKKGEWYNFKDFEGDQGWVHNSIVNELSTVITRKDRCIIRNGPGPTQDILFIAEKGVPFKVIGTKGHWFNVEHADGDTGWIYKSLIW